MSESFDPYLQWLGIRDADRPPNHYRLLGVVPFEDDPEVLANSADRQMAHVRTFQTGRHSADSQRLLNELATAKICLLNVQKKTKYDAELRSRLRPVQPPEAETPPPVQGVTVWQPPAVAPPLVPGPIRTEPEAAQTKHRAGPMLTLVVAIGAIGVVLAALVLAVLATRRSADSPAEVPQVSDVQIASTPKVEPPPKPDSVPKLPPTPLPEPQPEPKPAAGPDVEPDHQPPPDTSVDSQPQPEPLPPAGNSIRAARAAVSDRDTASAKQFLDRASKVASAKERAEIDRLRRVLVYLEVFWDAAEVSLSALGPGQQLDAGAIAVSVVRVDGAIDGAIDGSVIVVTQDGKQTEYTLRTLPAKLTLALAERKLPDEPSSLLAKAAFLTFDPGGDLGMAYNLVRAAAGRGLPTAELIEELRQAQRRRYPRPERAPIPDESARADALAEVREVFGDNYARAKTREEKSNLAKRLLGDALETKDNPAARYVLFTEASDMAADAGDVMTLAKAISAISARYTVDWSTAAADSMQRASRRARTKPANRATAHLALAFAYQSLAQDRFDQAAVLAKAATAMGRKGRDPATLKQAVTLEKDLDGLREQYEAFRAAGKVLASDPDNPQANLVQGRYYCLVKNNWYKGLRMIAKGDDAKLKGLAEAEIRRPSAAIQMAALGDRWWDAQKSFAPPLRPYVQRRAAYWYRRALPRLEGITKTKVQRRLADLKLERPNRRN